MFCKGGFPRGAVGLDKEQVEQLGAAAFDKEHIEQLGAAAFDKEQIEQLGMHGHMVLSGVLGMPLLGRLLDSGSWCRLEKPVP
jgi:hypothetical protein